ncbi:TetR/AcrR family transcriptional regulator [Eubacteriaceae bacterium ES2]|nr:TetR/AcrR family transcriptional regulator [Eubacteriaceae bacterium ES2]
MNKNDLRSIKTERAIKKTFHQLAQEKEIKKITVRELAERAEINKTTFYGHYDNIDDLIESLEKETIDYIISHLENFNSLFNDPDAFIENFYQTLLATHIDNIISLNINSRYFKEKIDNSIQEEMNRSNIDINQYRTFQIFATFIINGLLALLREKPQLSNEDLDIIKRFIKNGIHNFT